MSSSYVNAAFVLVLLISLGLFFFAWQCYTAFDEEDIAVTNPLTTLSDSRWKLFSFRSLSFHSFPFAFNPRFKRAPAKKAKAAAKSKTASAKKKDTKHSSSKKQPRKLSTAERAKIKAKIKQLRQQQLKLAALLKHRQVPDSMKSYVDTLTAEEQKKKDAKEKAVEEKKKEKEEEDADPYHHLPIKTAGLDGDDFDEYSIDNHMGENGMTIGEENKLYACLYSV